MSGLYSRLTNIPNDRDRPLAKSALVGKTVICADSTAHYALTNRAVIRRWTSVAPYLHAGNVFIEAQQKIALNLPSAWGVSMMETEGHHRDGHSMMLSVIVQEGMLAAPYLAAGIEVSLDYPLADGIAILPIHADWGSVDPVSGFWEITRAARFVLDQMLDISYMALRLMTKVQA